MTEAADTGNFAAVLRRDWLILVIGTVLGMVGGGIYLALAERQYTAEAELLFRDPGLDDKVFGNDTAGSATDPARDSATNTRLASLDEIVRLTGRSLDRSPRFVRRHVSVNGDANSDVVTVAATNPDPGLAATVANAYAKEFIAFRRRADRSAIETTQALVESELERLTESEVQSSEGSNLRRQADQLKILASLQTGNVELVQEAVTPLRPSWPRSSLSLGAGLLAGLLVSFTSVLARGRVDDRLRSASDVETAARVPILARIPRSSGLSERSTQSSANEVRRLSEPFKFMLARLRYFNVDGQRQVVLITSPEPSAGKSTVSWHLAATAVSGVDAPAVLLLEVDLRRPAIADRHGLRAQPGLADVLSGVCKLEDAVQRTPVVDGHLDVLVAGSIPPNPGEMLQSSAFRELLNQLREQYHTIVLDSAPALSVADSLPLSRQVDGVVVVARMGQSRRSQLLQVLEELSQLEAPVLGAVANGAAEAQDGYGYGYAARNA